jgi:L-ascorbate metabolism protein UlaG (beta-lactamase superfamily)
VKHQDVSLRLTYIGGPTALLELDGVRLLTDPTFDAAGTEYPTPMYTLRKTQGPALLPEDVGPVDVVLLSHDHHFDNLDHLGRQFALATSKVVTTAAGAKRLGPVAVGLEAWQSHDIPTTGGRLLRITATTARHGPADGDRGPVIGFALAFADTPTKVVYVSGDSVWYEGVAEAGRRFHPRVALLFAGAARVREVGPAHLTFTAAEAVLAARAFEGALIVPLHFEGWAHFSESRADIERAFAEAGLSDRLLWPTPGRAFEIPVTRAPW